MIKKIEVQNFRNIKNGEYNLNGNSVISGKNFTGKTNLLNAIYWVLTDKLLGDSSDSASLKPTNDTKQEVYVKLTFENDHYIEKTYKEKWTTTRGTGIEKLTGHETKVIIDDLVVPQSKVSEKIKTDFLDILYKTESKVDIIQAFIDPLYLWTDTSNLKMKDRRAFLIELVGDVDLQQVCQNPEIASSVFLPETLSKIEFFKGNIANAMTHFKNNVKKVNDELTILQNQINGERNKTDVDPEELENANKRIEELNKLIESRKQMKSTMVNPMVQKITDDIIEKEKTLLGVKLNDSTIYRNMCKAVDEQNKDLKLKIAEKQKDVYNIEKQIEKISFLQIANNNKIKENSNAIERLQKEAEQARKEFMVEKERTFTPFVLPEIKTCPHCGGSLNDDIVNQVKEQNEKNLIEFNKVKEERLSKIREKGHTSKDETERLTLENQELEKQNINLSKEQEQQKQQYNLILNEIETLNGKVESYPEFQQNELVKTIEQELNALKLNLQQEKQVDYTANIEDEIREYKKEILSYDPIIQAHSYYTYTQKVITQLEADIEKFKVSKAQEESKLMLCELILTTKLDLLRKQVESIFGEIEIKLVESNIKEGSWNEVCYPLILDEKTGNKVPFEYASRSQKYINGIKLLECLRKATCSGSSSPILIDEIGTFDNDTIKTRLLTKSQIIATRCDDNYTKPTIINL